MNPHSRREFLATTTAAVAGTSLSHLCAAAEAESIIDIHQHTNYSGRTDQQLLAHQRAMGIITTILLPAGRPVTRPSTHEGKSNGLAAMRPCRPWPSGIPRSLSLARRSRERLHPEHPAAQPLRERVSRR